ncbi:8504_t:CDS:2 [Diversispora eburnea]|uniref:8504_t:CDS:1 n=1 Tax=Diversispora eburnea TaxID=1213867 RepID=A0A9N9D2L7_9GLOM|nr:8504_t:CDS:2 [Diversispora eburnea]
MEFYDSQFVPTIIVAEQRKNQDINYSQQTSSENNNVTLISSPNEEEIIDMTSGVDDDDFIVITSNRKDFYKTSLRNNKSIDDFDACKKETKRSFDSDDDDDCIIVDPKTGEEEPWNPKSAVGLTIRKRILSSWNQKSRPVLETLSPSWVQISRNTISGRSDDACRHRWARLKKRLYSNA